MHPSWQGEPADAGARRARADPGPSLDGLNNAEGGVGGPLHAGQAVVLRRRCAEVADRVIPNAFYRGRQAGRRDRQGDRTSPLRLTWQATARNQFTGYYDWVVKTQLLGVAPGIDVETVARPSKSTPYVQAQAKWTSTVTSRLIVEVGADRPTGHTGRPVTARRLQELLHARMVRRARTGPTPRGARRPPPPRPGTTSSSRSGASCRARWRT